MFYEYYFRFKQLKIDDSLVLFNFAPKKAIFWGIPTTGQMLLNGQKNFQTQMFMFGNYFEVLFRKVARILSILSMKKKIPIYVPLKR